MSSRLVDYGNGLVAPLPTPASERKPLPDATPETIRPDGWRQANPSIGQQRLQVQNEQAREENVRARAAKLEEKAKGAVWVRLRNGATMQAGGELLVQVLAGGAQPIQ
jgi:hypothetical protein